MTHEKLHSPWTFAAALSLVGGLVLGCQKPLEMHFPESKPKVVYRDMVWAKPYVTGRLTGVVEWIGEKPKAEPISGLIDTKDGAAWGEVENPFEPVIQADGRVMGVVLQVLNPPAEITERWAYGEFTICKLTKQGFNLPAFIKLGSELTLVSDEKYSQIRVRGASFFTRSFSNTETEHKVTLDQPGYVEFTKTNGQFWMNSRVWVCSHPYFAKSDDKGNFDLGRLPTGEYDIHASIPNWQIVGRDRDPETGRIMQLHRGPDITTVQRVKVEAGKESKITLKLYAPRD
jgi:hypothetical protein